MPAYVAYRPGGMPEVVVADARPAGARDACESVYDVDGIVETIRLHGCARVRIEGRGWIGIEREVANAVADALRDETADAPRCVMGFGPAPGVPTCVINTP